MNTPKAPAKTANTVNTTKSAKNANTSKTLKTSPAPVHTPPPPTAAEPDWLRPITTQQPCGPHLEYDAEYAVLSARIVPQAETQYGAFINKPETPDWADIERDCRRLLMRSKDLTVLLWLSRCRTRLAGAQGLREALQMLLAIVERFPEDVHPQLVIDGEKDPIVRSNALAALCDHEGLLSDIRDVLVSSHTAARLTVRDVEKALAVPRASDALPAEAVRLQLDALHAQHHAPVQALAEAAQMLQKIQHWSQQWLGDNAPELQLALKLLNLFKAPAATATAASSPAQPQNPSTPATLAIPAATPIPPAAALESLTPPLPAPAAFNAWVQPSFNGSHLEQREQVRAYLRAAKEWLEQHEPSSPVAILLKQADRFLGQRYAEIAHAIPPDLLAQWDAQ